VYEVRRDTTPVTLESQQTLVTSSMKMSVRRIMKRRRMRMERMRMKNLV
jgi:hypothetical protein